MTCTCCIVPRAVLERLARDRRLPAAARRAAADTARVSAAIRAVRSQTQALTRLTAEVGMAAEGAVARAPKVAVYDCRHTQTLPGTPVTQPPRAADATARRTYVETTAVARFYRQVFGRNSIDDAGMTMLSSIHYGVKFNNAMWNGAQMIYGDGDASIFVDFTRGNDVVAHELTHGVTEHSLQLDYANDAGGLNESLSDVFGIMFRQWEAAQDVRASDWRIGADILGPAAKARGYTCLRNMAAPADRRALAAQPERYDQVKRGMDPHLASGPPSLAFCVACTTLGGKSWERIGQVWYAALTTSGPVPKMTMPAFAKRTRALATQMYGREPAVRAAVDAGWARVGL